VSMNMRIWDQVDKTDTRCTKAALAGQRAHADKTGREEIKPQALPHVLGRAVDSFWRVARPLADDGFVQGEHGLSRAGGVQVEMGLGDCGSGTGHQCVSDTGRFWRPA